MSVILGAIGSLIAAVVWVISLRLLRPRIDIAPKISLGLNSTGHHIYRIKIVNRGRFEAVNVRVELHRLVNRPAPNGVPVFLRQPVDLKTTHLVSLPRYRKRDQAASYAFRLTTYVDLRELVNDPGIQLRLTVYAEHPISRVVRTFHRHYGDESCVRFGNYQGGKTTDIEELSALPPTAAGAKKAPPGLPTLDP